MSGRRPGRGRQAAPAHGYARTARVNQLLREILGEALERLDDDRLDGVVVTDVRADPEVRTAQVFFDSRLGPDADTVVAEALDDYRTRLQGAIARQARLRHTPTLAFHPDEAIRSGERIDAVLRDNPLPPERAGDGRDGPDDLDGRDSRDDLDG